MQRFDTIVLGLGAMGSAALYHLARRGGRVLGIDRHSPPHARGSSHGDTRITRLAIGEGAQYTPFALRSHQLWRQLEEATGESLLTSNGGLIISRRATPAIMHGADFLTSTLAAAAQYGIEHEVLDAVELKQRFPQFIVEDEAPGYFEPAAGFLRPEACVRAHLAMAESCGAIIARNERGLTFDASANTVTVTTERDVYAANTLIVAAGPWLPELIGSDLARQFRIFRQVLFWFDIDGPITPFLPQNFPVFIRVAPGVDQSIYGFPALDGARGGIKVGVEQYATTTTPDRIERTVSEEEITTMHEQFVVPHLRSVSRTCLRATTCLYTVTPDFGFVIDRHPDSERVIIASPCSGHGFKHSAAIGEALAQLAVDGSSLLDLSDFKWRNERPDITHRGLARRRSME
ncbi:MAG: N-methyl-L-tryptophan oxidase [Burkholderiaceae bacterium]